MGRHAAQPAPARPHPVASTSRAALARARCLRGAHRRRRARASKRYGLEHADQPVLADRRGALPGRAGGARRRRPPGDRPAGGRRGSSSTTRCSSRSPTRGRAGHRPRRARRPAECRAEPEAAPLHPHGNLVRHLKIRKGDPDADAPTSSSSGDYEVGMQDQAFLGPESGLAVPGRGRRRRPLRRHPVAARRPAADLRVRSACRPEKVRLTLAGVGGAFGGREDLSMHVHACLLALHTGKPVKMVYNREESFFGHVHRHPAWMRYEHGADRDGKLVYVKADDLPRRRRLRVAAPPAVVGNAGHDGHRPVRRARTCTMDCYGAYTNNPPCGAMRGFGCGAGRVRATSRRWTSSPTALGMDPVEMRLPQRDGARASVAPTGQVIDSAGAGGRAAAPAAGDAAAAAPAGDDLDLRRCPAASSNTTHGEGVRRGVGYAVGIQEHRLLRGLRRLLDRAGAARGGRRRAGRHRAHRGRRGRPGPGHRRAADLPHRARRRRGSSSRRRTPRSGRGGSTSASRQTYVTGGAVQGGLRGGARPRAGAAALARRAATTLRLGRRGRRHRGRGSSAWPTCSATTRSRRPSSGGTGPTEADRPGDRAGRRARAVRVRRAPGRRRRRRRARPGQGGRAGLHARTSARRSTRRRSSARSTAAARRAWGWR